MTPTSKLVLPVGLWGGLQLILLGCGASGFPLWAHHPLPRESLAMQEMWCGQILIISMLFPMLANSRSTLVINLVLMLPFDELAGFLSNMPQMMIARGSGCVALWLIGLGLWRKFRVDLMIAMLAMALSTGGAMLDYLRWEATLAVGGLREFHPASLLSSICLERWAPCFLRSGVPATSALVALLIYKLSMRAQALPTSLHTE